MRSVVPQEKISGKGCVRGGQRVASNRIVRKGQAGKGTCEQRPEEVRDSKQTSGQGVPGSGRSKRGSRRWRLAWCVVRASLARRPE